VACYGIGNLGGTLVFGNLALPRRRAPRVFGGILVFGGATVAMAAAMLLPPGWQLAGIAAAAAVAAIGGPMQDIVTATLRQTEVAPADVAAAMRAYMVSVQAGTVLAMVAAPSLVGAIGPAGVVLGGGLVYLVVGAYGLARVRG